MILNFSKSGNMCNQLIQLMHVSALAIESQQKVYHLFAGDLSNVIDFSGGRKHDIFVVGGLAKTKLWSKVRKKIELLYVNNDYESYVQKSIASAQYDAIKMQEPGFHVTNSWYVREYNLLKKHRNKILDIIGTYPIVQQHTTLKLNQMREDNTLLIGVHMRRGDYRDWRGGEFFYTDQEWNSIFGNIVRIPEFKEKHIKFLVFSNEKVQIENYSRKFDITPMNGNVAEDLTALSKCDCIIGPPSTYSWVANFIGGNLYYVIFNPNKDIFYTDFKNDFKPEVTSANIEELKKENS